MENEVAGKLIEQELLRDLQTEKEILNRNVSMRGRVGGDIRAFEVISLSSGVGFRISLASGVGVGGIIMTIQVIG